MKTPRKTPSRDEKYMGLAFLVAGFSKDPNTQVGAVCVRDEDNWPLGYGYNGPPRQYRDSSVDWSRPKKYKDIRHAEINAMDHSGNCNGVHLYVTGKPCSVCMLDIVARGIDKVTYFPYVADPKSSFNSDLFDSTEDIARSGNVTLEKFSGNLNWIRDWVDRLEELGIFNTDPDYI